MRIIAGSHRGRRIAAPKGRATRPTSDRVRENAFNLIGPVDDAEGIDLFAGSGALGLEALSRGAARMTFVESDRDACRVINANLETLALRGTVLCQDVARALAQERRDYDLVLCDPPYGYDLGRIAGAFQRLVRAAGVLVLESSSREEAPELGGLSVRTTRRYGSARLTLYEL
jgi:16S rRNA (guanine966-N2)-methyltransferase